MFSLLYGLFELGNLTWNLEATKSKGERTVICLNWLAFRWFISYILWKYLEICYWSAELLLRCRFSLLGFNLSGQHFMTRKNTLMPIFSRNKNTCEAKRHVTVIIVSWLRLLLLSQPADLLLPHHQTKTFPFWKVEKLKKKQINIRNFTNT